MLDISYAGTGITVSLDGDALARIRLNPSEGYRYAEVIAVLNLRLAMHGMAIVQNVEPDQMRKLATSPPHPAVQEADDAAVASAVRYLRARDWHVGETADDVLQGMPIEGIQFWLESRTDLSVVNLDSWAEVAEAIKDHHPDALVFANHASLHAYLTRSMVAMVGVLGMFSDSELAAELVRRAQQRGEAVSRAAVETLDVVVDVAKAAPDQPAPQA